MFATCIAFYKTACPLRCSDHTETEAVKPGIGTQLLSLAAATRDKSKTAISHRDSPARYDKNIKHQIMLFHKKQQQKKQIHTVYGVLYAWVFPNARVAQRLCP